MITIKEEKIAELMFDIWHKSNDLKNPVIVGEYIAEELNKVKNLPIQRVVNWLPLEAKHYDLFTELARKNKLLKKFDDGTILKDGDEEPIAICTHFAEEI